MGYNFFKTTLFVLAFVATIFCNSQITNLDQLDHITEENENAGNIKSAIAINIDALKFFRKTHNATGAVISLIHIGNLLTTLGDYHRSIQYLDQAKKRLTEIDNPALESKLYTEYGRTYSLLGLHKQANLKLDEALEFAKKVTNKVEKNTLIYESYTWKWYNFEMLKETDSVCSMQRKCLKLSPTPMVNIKIASSFINQKKHLDSAEYYLQKVQSFKDKKTINEEGLINFNYGKLYTLKNDHKKALDYYLKYLGLSKKMRNTNYVRDAYKEISNSYKALDDTEDYKINLNRYLILNDSIYKVERKVLHEVTEKLITENEQNDFEERSKLYVIFFCTIIFLSALLFFVYKKYKKSKILIDEKLEETDLLKKKINVSFNEITELAKNKDPFFLIRFKEVYPEFYKKLIDRFPNLTDHDIKFCAYIRLNLSHKEIAQYENITLKSVEIKKYRIKKKLQLDPEVDFNRWIADL